MKLKKIEQIIKKAKRIVVFNSPECQWLGDGYACYPMYDLPHLSNGEFFALFDIPDSQRGNFGFSIQDLPSFLNFKDDDQSELLLKREDYTLNIQGRTLEILPSRHGMSFIDTKYLKPFSGAEDGFELYERISAGGNPYIAVKEGLFLIGIILPFDLHNDEKLIDTLDKLKRCAEKYRDYRETLNCDISQTELDGDIEVDEV